jgi:hypothetical protein
MNTRICIARRPGDVWVVTIDGRTYAEHTGKNAFWEAARQALALMALMHGEVSSR